MGIVDNDARERGMNWSCPQQLTVGGYPASESGECGSHRERADEDLKEGFILGDLFFLASNKQLKFYPVWFIFFLLLEKNLQLPTSKGRT